MFTDSQSGKLFNIRWDLDKDGWGLQAGYLACEVHPCCPVTILLKRSSRSAITLQVSASGVAVNVVPRVDCGCEARRELGLRREKTEIAGVTFHNRPLTSGLVRFFSVIGASYVDFSGVIVHIPNICPTSVSA